jgi:hypothetical protein
MVFVATTCFKGTKDAQLTSTGTTLIFPAIAMVEKLRDIDEELFNEAKDYLFSKQFRFIFDGRQWPHMYVLRAFRKHVPTIWSSRVTRVYLAQFNVHVLFEQDKDVSQEEAFGIAEVIETYSDNLEQLRQNHYIPTADFRTLRNSGLLPDYASPYFAHLISMKIVPNGYMSSMIQKELRYGPRLLQMAFPALEKLDISLDIVDNLPPPVGRADLLPQALSDSLTDDFATWKMGCEAYMVLLELRNFAKSQHKAGAGKIDVHLIWEDFVQQAWDFGVDIIPEKQETFKNQFLYHLRADVNVAVKSITSDSV